MKPDNVMVELPAGWTEGFCEPEDAVSDPETSIRMKRIGLLTRSVGALNAIAAGLPKEYGWRFTTTENFSKIFEAAAHDGASVLELNSLYWRDVLATIEAYTLMAVWRMVDICQAGFRCVDEDAIVPAAILARSALESSIQFVEDAGVFTTSLEHLLTEDLAKGMVSSAELEAYLVRTVYATRQSGADEIYKSRNILTTLAKVAKLTEEPVEREYELLCEVTHPNFLGRSTYIVSAEAREDGSELRVISPRTGLDGGAIIQSTMWAFAWATEAQVKSTHLVQSAVGDVIMRLRAVRASVNSPTSTQ